MHRDLQTINNIGPEYMNSPVVSNQSHYSSRRPLNLFVPRINETTYGLKTFRYQSTEEIKTASNPRKDHNVDTVFALIIMERIRVCLLASLTTQFYSYSLNDFCAMKKKKPKQLVCRASLFWHFV